MDFLTHIFASLNAGAVGGSLLLLDMVLFAVLAAFWEEAGRIGSGADKKGTLPPRR